MALAHWDEVDPRIVDLGPLGFRRFDLGRAAGSRGLGLTRSLVEAARGRPDLPEPSPLPETIVRSDELEGEYDGRWKGLARAAGAIRTGLNLVDLRAREEGAPPHLHSADEELFVVLAGSGTLE